MKFAHPSHPRQCFNGVRLPRVIAHKGANTFQSIQWAEEGSFHDLGMNRCSQSVHAALPVLVGGRRILNEPAGQHANTARGIDDQWAAAFPVAVTQGDADKFRARTRHPLVMENAW